MFPLHRRSLPASKDELAQAIEEELRRFAHKTGPIVDVRSRAFPSIDEIVINLDRAEVERLPAPPLITSDPTKPAFEIGLINLSARKVRFRGTPIDLRFEARGVFLEQALDANGEIVLLPRRIGDGETSLSATLTDLEKAITRLVTEQARAHGVTIEQVQLALRERGARSIGGEVRIQARKLVRAKVEIYGQLDIDENFVATISQLRCHGAGILGSRACSALEPHLQRVRGWSFSLKLLPPRETRIRDLSIAVTDTVELRLAFGNGKAQT
jgi:hypothetical protein